jgi:hypothetical protein
MSFSKQLTQLGLLGSFTLVGLSACTTCPGYRAPQGLCEPSQTVVTASPPVTEAAPSTLSTTPPVAPPPDETSAGSTLSVPGPVGQAPTTGADSGTSKPSDFVAPPPAPAAVPPAPEPPNRVGGSSAGITTPAAESNADQPRTQKPLDVLSIPDPAEGQTQAAAAPPADHPIGPLARLRARFHDLIQPPPKTAAKSSNAAKATGPAATPQASPQVVASVRLPLPVSDSNRVVQEDSRAAHTILPETDGQIAVTPNGVRAVQTAQAPADAAGLQVDEAAQRGGGKTVATQEIEQWPFGPQAAVQSTNVPNRTPTDDFDPIPVDEYKAAIVRANDATSLPTFNRTPPSESRQATTVPSNAPVSQPMAAAQNTSELQVVPRAVAPLQERPMPVPQGNPAAQVDAPSISTSQQAVSSTGPLPQTVPAAAAGAAGAVAPAIEISPAPSAEQVAPTSVRPARPAQWIGGRYGQPAWMVPYMAGQQGSGQ